MRVVTLDFFLWATLAECLTLADLRLGFKKMTSPHAILSQHLDQNPVSHWQWSPLKTPLSLSLYEDWLEQNMHAEMHYLKEHLAQKKQFTSLLPQAHSVITLAFSYFPHPLQPIDDFPHALKTAFYAKGEDYHNWIPKFLSPLLADLQKLYPDETFLLATDSKPILERDLHYQSGMGWFGRNSCLIHPEKGSLFLLAEILTSVKTPESFVAPLLIPDFCGTCNRCVESCPTEAINGNRTLDANKCISYWTIESQNVPDHKMREKIGSWFFGCDICQTVCPWNEKMFRSIGVKPKTDDPENKLALEEQLTEILTLSGKALEKKLGATPLMRARPFGLKRNALVVIGNLKLHSCKKAVELFLTHDRLAELATWTLAQLET